MGAIWAHRLPEYLTKWQVPFVLVPGWTTRSRSTGGFDSVKGVGIHHTASRTLIQNDLNWEYYNSPDRPIGNGNLARDGVFHFGAAGATNTQGKGGPTWTSRGVIPLDSGNRHMFSIEAANNGTGEPWTEQQQWTYPRLVAAVLDWANNETPGAPLSAGDVFAHFEWAPGRKIDPAGPSQWAPNGGMWNMDAFRGSVWLLQQEANKPEPAPIIFDPVNRQYGLWPLNGSKEVLRKGSSGDAVLYLKGVIHHEAQPFARWFFAQRQGTAEQQNWLNYFSSDPSCAVDGSHSNYDDRLVHTVNAMQNAFNWSAYDGQHIGPVVDPAGGQPYGEVHSLTWSFIDHCSDGKWY